MEPNHWGSSLQAMPMSLEFTGEGFKWGCDMRGFSSQGQKVEGGLGWEQEMIRWREIGQMERRLLQSSTVTRSESGLEGRSISHG